MTPASLLLIHAGLRPGELILAHADGSSPVFLPPTERVHRFEVGKNTQLEEWALLRRYVSAGEADALLTFTSESDAQRALEELHKALLEPAPAVDRPRLGAWIQENGRPLAAAAAFLVAIASLSYCGKHKPEAFNSAPTPISAGASTSTPYAVSGSLPAADTAQAAPDTATATSAMSAGDALLQQIHQSNPSGQAAAPDAGATQATPAAASPGDALLQQIQGH